MGLTTSSLDEIRLIEVITALRNDPVAERWLVTGSRPQSWG